jgi:Na+/H+ antiporter NhaD/arsenite permease-like protein
MSLKTELKNPIAWSLVALVLGCVLAAWGHDKDESTITSRVPGGVAMMVIGGVMAVGGLIGFFTFGKRK